MIRQLLRSASCRAQARKYDQQAAVFNASRPSENAVSLNDIFHAGPVLQSDLTIQILKWLYFRYVYSADIKRMYRQIWVPTHLIPQQRDAHS